MRTILPLVLALTISGCVQGPNYVRPELPAPESWRVNVETATAIANLPWWQSFGDPVLDTLMRHALRENRDIRIAAARIERLLGALQTTQAGEQPQLGYSGTLARNRVTQVGSNPAPYPWSSLYSAALNADWQLDLFGRIQRETEAAQAQVFASEQGRRGVILSVSTAVAAGYIGLRALDQQLSIARATASNYQDTLKLFELRYQAGIVSEMEVVQVRSQYQQAQAAIPVLETQIAAQENLLSLLLGQAPQAIPRGKTIEELSMPPIPAGLPSSLVERRPDLLQAEQNLIAANAQVGVARSLYYPSLSLTGVLGSSSAQLADFLGAGSGTLGLAAGISGPILSFGRIEGQEKSAEAARHEALITYEQTVLKAFGEVNNALMGFSKKKEELGIQKERLASLKEYSRLARLRFDNGTACYLEVLYAENNYFSAQLAEVSVRADSYARLVDLYKSLGGGWIDAAERFSTGSGS